MKPISGSDKRMAGLFGFYSWVGKLMEQKHENDITVTTT